MTQRFDAEASAPRLDAAHRAALVRAQRRVPEFVEELRQEVASKGSGEHDSKYFGAAEAIAASLSPALREGWVAAAALAHPIGSTGRWERAEEATSLLARART